MKKKPSKKAKRQNLHEQLSERRSRRPIGHENGKRIKAQNRVRLTGPDGDKIFEGTDREFKDAVHRVTTHQPNGGLSESMEVAVEKVSIGEAMRRAVEELGDVKIDQELAPKQLAELAECYEDVTRRQAAFNTKNDEAKTAKKSLESATDLLLEKVRLFTHPKPLPLFDQQEAEEDRQEMELGAEAATQELGL